MNSFPESLIEKVRHSTEQATQEASRLRAELEQAEHVYQFMEKLSSFASKGWVFHILDLKQQQTPLLDRMMSGGHPAVETVEEICNSAVEQVAKFSFARFPSILASACQNADLPFDRESRHPTYLFDENFLKLTINESEKTAQLSNYEASKLWEMPCDAGAIVEGIQHEHQRLFERSFDGEAFLKKLHRQYQTILKKEEKKDGDSVPIRDITRRLGKNESKFRTDEFLIDLSRLVKEGPTEIEGQCLELQQTKDERRGMLLHGREVRGYVGFIIFK